MGILVPIEHQLCRSVHVCRFQLGSYHRLAKVNFVSGLQLDAAFGNRIAARHAKLIDAAVGRSLDTDNLIKLCGVEIDRRLGPGRSRRRERCLAALQGVYLPAGYGVSALTGADCILSVTTALRERAQRARNCTD